MLNPTDTIDPESVTQNLHFATENKAHVDISWVGQSEERTVKTNGDYYDGDTGVHIDGKPSKAAVDTRVARFNNDVSGNFMTVTETDLTHSYYIDPVTNQKKLIKRLVFRMGNLKVNPVATSHWIGYNSTYGFQLYGIKSVTLQKIEAYDESGKLINMTPGTAWLQETSLSMWKVGDNGQHIEWVSVGGGNSIYQIPERSNPDGGPVALKDGNKVAPVMGRNFTNNDSGEAVVRLVPGGTITFGIDDDTTTPFGVDFGDDGWSGSTIGSKDWYQFTISTYLKPSTNPSPKRKTSSTSYHYNVAQAKRVYSTTERETRSLAITKKCQNSDKNLCKYLVKNEADYGHKPLILW